MQVQLHRTLFLAHHLAGACLCHHSLPPIPAPPLLSARLLLPVSLPIFASSRSSFSPFYPFSVLPPRPRSSASWGDSILLGRTPTPPTAYSTRASHCDRRLLARLLSISHPGQIIVRPATDYRELLVSRDSINTFSANCSLPDPSHGITRYRQAPH